MLVGAATFCAGFGIGQNATLSLMYTRVSKAGYGTVSAIWNFSCDSGMAVGAISAELLATATGYTPTVLITADTTLRALAMASRPAAPQPDPPSGAEPALCTDPVRA